MNNVSPNGNIVFAPTRPYCEDMTQQALTNGAHHVGLTVPDVRATAAFFLDGLGYHQVGEKPAYPAVFVSDGALMLTLWQTQAAEPRPFDRHEHVGLHHLALRVDGDLQALHERLAARDDVSIEFAPESLGGAATRHMMVTVPGGVRVEFITPAKG